MRKIAIGADHGGYALKKAIVKTLRKTGFQVKDFGTDSAERCDYPPIGYKVASAVASGRYGRGILICKSGLGMSMVANKVPGIRAALLTDMASVRSSREHNDANIAVFSGDRTSGKKAAKMLKVWFETEFLGGRHERRVRQMESIGKRLRRGR